MVITVNGQAITLDLDTILIWALVGLVAGFLATSRWGTGWACWETS